MPKETKPKTAKQMSADSYAARSARINATGEFNANQDSIINQKAMNAKKNEYGMPVGSQRIKKDPYANRAKF